MSSQLSIDLAAEIPKDAYNYGARSSGETHGVVLTKRHVVDMMLDLAGYTPDLDLTKIALLEPACGRGAFLVPAVERLLRAAQREGRDPGDLADAILGYDIDPSHVASAREAVVDVLTQHGVSPAIARRLSLRWVIEGDFLLASIARRFDVVVGNPPYVRIEQIAGVLQSEYRRRYSTLFDRADLYVAFIERGLMLLSGAGRLCFVCAGRWVLNRYGAPLRAMITRDFKVECYLDLQDASPFESEVVAYPSIFTLSRGRSERVLVGRLATASDEECARLLRARQGDSAADVDVSYCDTWFERDVPWVLGSPAQIRALRDLEARFPTIEAGGAARVGIGVATGCDRVFVVGADADIEPERLVPVVMREDIKLGGISDAHRRVINVFGDDGRLIELALYPRLAAYFDQHRDAVRGRHVAQKNPNAWFRTIDRVHAALVATPKLLIPDIAGSNEVAYDSGSYHPHHNLYFVTSESWDLEVLGGLLSSRVALFFVWSYAVKMRGGYLRFQAQYLRRICVPRARDLTADLAAALRDAFRRRDFRALDSLALRAYGIESLPDFEFVDTRR